MYPNTLLVPVVTLEPSGQMRFVDAMTYETTEVGADTILDTRRFVCQLGTLTLAGFVANAERSVIFMQPLVVNSEKDWHDHMVKLASNRRWSSSPEHTALAANFVRVLWLGADQLSPAVPATTSGLEA